MHTAGHGAAARRQFFGRPGGTWQKGLTDRCDWCAQAEGVGAEEAAGRSRAQKGAEEVQESPLLYQRVRELCPISFPWCWHSIFITQFVM